MSVFTYRGRSASGVVAGEIEAGDRMQAVALLRAKGVVATAVQEDADAIGLSVLSGAHNYLFQRILELLREKDSEDIVVFGGGIIPPADAATLKTLGVKELFGPGTSTQDIIRFVRENVRAVV